MIIINPREVAASAIVEITRGDAYNNMVLKKILKQNGAMSVQDKAFVTEIVNGTLRNLYYIDFVIDKLSTLKAEKMKPWIISVLRTAIYQIKFMDKVPNSAVCNEAVNLVKEKGFGKLTGFVNGILRRFIRENCEVELPDETLEGVKFLSVKYSHPEWLLKMWLHEYSYDFVKELCEKNNAAPDVTINCNNLKISTEDLKKELLHCGLNIKDGIYNKNAFHISKSSDMSKLDAFKNGYFHVQDESSIMAVKVLDPKEGEKILDVCAAPGGKSVFAAEIMRNKGEIIARDVYAHKLDLIDENALRLGIDIIKTQNKDASIFDEKDSEMFDKVLIDAPCSGLGIIRKKPDIKLRKNGNDIDSLCQIQKNILESSGKCVKIGGILVYSTCTICKKENIKNIEWFLKNFDFKLSDIREYLSESVVSETAKDGYIQLFPNVHNTDGFFIARMIRKG